MNKEDWEIQLPQAILGALEHRGFNDCGKYLDETFLERISPIIRTAISKAVARQREEDARIVENMSGVADVDIREGIWLVGQDEAATLIRSNKIND